MMYVNQVLSTGWEMTSLNNKRGQKWLDIRYIQGYNPVQSGTYIVMGLTKIQSSESPWYGTYMYILIPQALIKHALGTKASSPWIFNLLTLVNHIISVMTYFIRQKLSPLSKGFANLTCEYNALTSMKKSKDLTWFDHLCSGLLCDLVQ